MISSHNKTNPTIRPQTLFCNYALRKNKRYLTRKTVTRIKEAAALIETGLEYIQEIEESDYAENANNPFFLHLLSAFCRGKSSMALARL
jgi:hypothetical protein